MISEWLMGWLLISISHQVLCSFLYQPGLVRGGRRFTNLHLKADSDF